MIIIGIDPGKTGGVAVINDKGETLHTEVMGDSGWFIKFIKWVRQQWHEQEIFVYLEKAQPVHGNGLVSMFSYADHFGELKGILKTLEMPFELIPPQTWTKEMHIGASLKFRAKDKSRQIAQRLFPLVDLTDPDKPSSKKIHEGIMDARIIAEYGRRRQSRGHE